MNNYEKILEIASNRNIFYPSYEIYGGVSGFYDFGEIGILLRENIIRHWKKTLFDENTFEVDTALIAPYIVLEASGHVAEFTDPIAECGNCQYKARADKIAEEQINGFVFRGNIEELKEIKDRLKCPKCSGKIKEIYQKNLMFSTSIGYDGDKGFLRPETAQGIFTSFQRFYKIKGKLPFAIAQCGRSFRNEISPRKGLIRLREFTQMEIEYFFNPNKPFHKKFKEIENLEFFFKHRGKNEIIKETAKSLVEKNICSEIFAYYLAKQWKFFSEIGIKKMWFRHLEKFETPHYSKGNIDLEVETSLGVIEISGNADRTDYDLKRHAKYSNKDINVIEEGLSFIPNVFETSIGLERTLFCILDNNFMDKSKDRDWYWFKLPSIIAPYKIAVFPLVQNNEKILEISREVKEMLKDYKVFYLDKGSIGKRYAKADEIGVPYAITVDHQSIEDNTVTIRFRDSTKQIRVKINELNQTIEKFVNHDIQQ